MSIFDIVSEFYTALTSSVTTVQGNVTDLSDTTTTNVANLQNFTIATQTAGYRNPTWVSRYPVADVSYPDCQNLLVTTDGNTSAQTAGTAHTHNIDTAEAGPIIVGAAQNESIGSYVTISNPTVMNTVAMYLWVISGTVNNIFLEVFKENPSTTALTRITSNSVAGTLPGSPAYFEATLAAPIIAQPGERYMVRARNASSTVGIIGSAGLTRSLISPDIAFATTGTSFTAQTSYSAADVVTARATNQSLTWAMLANASPTASDVSFSDDFNRSQFGSLWLLISSWATQLGIVSTMATYQGTTNGDQQGLFIRSCNGDGNRVDFDVTDSALATTHARCGGFLHANQDLTQMVYLGVTDNAVNIYSGASTSPTSRATISTSSNDGTWSLIYDVPSNTYTAYLNGVAVGLSWNDSGNLMTHGDGYRFGGVRVSRVTAVNGGTVDNWTLRDYS